jgi:hypothetical protein
LRTTTPDERRGDVRVDDEDDEEEERLGAGGGVALGGLQIRQFCSKRPWRQNWGTRPV